MPKPHEWLDKLAQQETTDYLDRRAILFAEESAGYLVERFGTDGAAEKLRQIADQIEAFR